MAEQDNQKVEIAVLIEAWIKLNEEDEAWLNQSEFRQGNYYIITHNWPGENRGGGVAIVFRKTWK